VTTIVPRFRPITVAASLAAAPAVPGAAQQLSAEERLGAAAAVWAEARANYAGWDRVRADWDSALRATLVEAGVRQSDYQFLRRLRRMLALLGDPRAAIAAPTLRNRLARTPLDIRRIDNRPLILDYLETSEMRVARPERLAEIMSVQGIPSATWIRDSVLPEVGGTSDGDRWRRATPRMLDGERGTAVHLTLRLPDGSTRGASVTRSVPVADRWPLAPPPIQVVSLPDSIVLVRLTTFADADVVRRFDRLFQSWAGVRDLILDLRDNDAGDSETGYQILARLVAAPVLTVRRRTPRYQPVELGPITDDHLIGWTEAPPDTIQPGRDPPPFTGRIVVLTSAGTAGAAEDFIAGIRAAGRGVVVGERTAGAAGREITLPLPGDWRLHLTVTRHFLPDGTAVSGVGLAPDVPVEPSLRTLREGGDPALERARAYLSEGRRP
jgi:hypothetical protein